MRSAKMMRQRLGRAESALAPSVHIVVVEKTEAGTFESNERSYTAAEIEAPPPGVRFLIVQYV